MPSTATRILDGLSTSVAVKAPCRAVATSNITLSGLQTVGGVVLVEDDRVLVVGQTNAVNNGIYAASTGTWQRTLDADGNRDLVNGTLVMIQNGGDGIGYELVSDDPIVIGTTELEFELREIDSALRGDLNTGTSGSEGSLLVAHLSPVSGAVKASVYGVLRGFVTAGMFGLVGNGSTNERATLQSAVDAMSVFGTGKSTLLLDHSKTYRLVAGGTAVLGNVAALRIPSGVTIDCNGSTLATECGTGNEVSVWVYGSDNGIVNGSVSCTSSGSPSAQYFFHAPIAVGIHNNSGDTVASPSLGHTMRGWRIDGMTLSTTRVRCPAIQVMGCGDGTINKCHVPSSSTASGFHLDWSNVGSVSSAAIAATRALFGTDGDNCYTTHPNNVAITNCTAGTLSAAVVANSGTNLIRVSGCYAITVDGCSAESVTLAGVFHTGGDLGFEFAKAAVKRHACKGTRFSNIKITSPTSAITNGAFIDTYADNIAREYTYTPLLDPVMHGDVVIEGCNFIGGNSDNTFGIRITQCRGVKVRDNDCQRWKNGIVVDEKSYDFEVSGNTCTANRNEGIRTGLLQLREGIERGRVFTNTVYANGTDSAGSDMRHTRGKDVIYFDNRLGVAGTTQTFGLLVDDVACIRDVQIIANTVNGAATAAFGLVGSTPVDALGYRVISAFKDNKVAQGVLTLVSGSTYVPLSGKMFGNVRAMRWSNPNSSAPSNGTWYISDVLEPSSPAAAATAGHRCSRSGTFGTLATISNAVTNATRVITCSLTGLTANTTQGDYSFVISSATDIRAGMKVTIAAAGVTDAEVLSKSGTTIQIDQRIKTTQTGGAVTTCGLIEGEVVQINTTTLTRGAIVMLTSGTSVTLSHAPVDSQSGRTVTFETPTFVAEAALS